MISANEASLQYRYGPRFLGHKLIMSYDIIATLIYPFTTIFLSKKIIIIINKLVRG